MNSNVLKFQKPRGRRVRSALDGMMNIHWSVFAIGIVLWALGFKKAGRWVGAYCIERNLRKNGVTISDVRSEDLADYIRKQQR